MYDIAVISENGEASRQHKAILDNLCLAFGLNGNCIVTSDESRIADVAQKGAQVLVCDVDKLQLLNNAAQEKPLYLSEIPVVIMSEGVSLASLFVNDYSSLIIVGQIRIPYRKYHHGLSNLVEAIKTLKTEGSNGHAINIIQRAIARADGECVENPRMSVLSRGRQDGNNPQLSRA